LGIAGGSTSFLGSPRLTPEPNLV